MSYFRLCINSSPLLYRLVSVRKLLKGSVPTTKKSNLVELSKTKKVNIINVMRDLVRMYK